MSDTRRSDAVTGAKAAGFKAVSVPNKRGKNGWQLTNASGVPVQLGDSEDDVWAKAYSRGILPEVKK